MTKAVSERVIEREEKATFGGIVGLIFSYCIVHS